MSSKVVLVVLFAASGCVSTPSATGQIGAAQLDDDPGKKNQGESLRGTQLGSNFVGFGYSGVTGTRTVTLRIVNGQLVYDQPVALPPTAPPGGVHANSVANYLRLPAYAADGTTTIVYVRSIQPANAPATSLYDVRIGSLAGASICTGNNADEQMAIPLPGTWNAQGYHIDDSTRFTFACRRGVLSKCYFWGYRPWDTKNGQSLAPYHQACSRMARADYCGDGVAHTVDGTWIDGYDRMNLYADHQYDELGVLTFADNPEMLVEAGWGPDINDPPSGGAVCLSKQRWSTIALDPACRARLPQCDDGNGKQPWDWLNTTALIFSNSPVTDTALYTCGTPGAPPATCRLSSGVGASPHRSA
jgi:hypothetical protein